MPERQTGGGRGTVPASGSSVRSRPAARQRRFDAEGEICLAYSPNPCRASSGVPVVEAVAEAVSWVVALLDGGELVEHGVRLGDLFAGVVLLVRQGERGPVLPCGGPQFVRGGGHVGASLGAGVPG